MIEQYFFATFGMSLNAAEDGEKPCPGHSFSSGFSLMRWDLDERDTMSPGHYSELSVPL